MKTFFISDTHFHHKNMYNFTTSNPGQNFYVRPEFMDHEEGDAYMIEQWNSVVSPEDKVYFGGDFCFDQKRMEELNCLNGTKILILGNHDNYKMSQYGKIFKRIYSYRDLTRLFDINKKVVLTHCPSHMESFYPYVERTINIHGHIHEKCVRHADGTIDLRYQNISVELIGYRPIELDELREVILSGKSTYAGIHSLGIKRELRV